MSSIRDAKQTFPSSAKWLCSPVLVRVGIFRFDPYLSNLLLRHKRWHSPEPQSLAAGQARSLKYGGHGQTRTDTLTHWLLRPAWLPITPHAHI